MEFVKVDSGQGTWSGNLLDPEPYLKVLSVLLPKLPEGARRFAADEGHYDFTSPRCVKDLKVRAISMREVGEGRIGLVVEFQPNQFKHAGSLVIVYDDVQKFVVEVDDLNPKTPVWPESRRLGDVQLDEVVPTAVGCRHEVKLTGGRISVDCSDLRATWDEGEV